MRQAVDERVRPVLSVGYNWKQSKRDRRFSKREQQISVSIWPFIEQGADGIAYIEGIGTKVLEVALDQIAYDWDAAEIHRQYSYLSLPQIHAALGFYYENRSECDRLIDQQLAEVDQWREQSQNASLALKLNARRRKPGC